MGEILPLKTGQPRPPCYITHRKTRGSFVIIDSEFFRRWVKIFDPCTVSVYVFLCSMADKEHKCFPSMAKLAELVGFRKKNVLRSIRLLEFYELIAVTRRDRKVNVCWITDREQWKYPGEGNQLVGPRDYVVV